MKSVNALTRGKIIICSTGLSLTLLLGMFYIFEPQFLRIFDNKLYDQFLIMSHDRTTSNVPIIIDIDEESLRQHGQWPWPRYRIALLIEKIREAGVVCVGLDILFAEQDRASPRILKQELKQDLEVDVNFTGLPQALMDNDTILGDILANGPYVLGYYFDFNAEQARNDQANIHPLTLAAVKTQGAGDPQDYLRKAPAVVSPLEVLIQSVPASGFLNAIADEDGILRRTPLLIAWQEKTYPSLALATLQLAVGETSMSVKSTMHGIESLRIGSTTIPLDQEGNILINYRGGRNFYPHYSATSFLKNEINPGSLAGKIGLVGTSAAGLLDIRSTPLDSFYPGVEVHATIIDSILTENFITRPDWADAVELSMIFFWGITLSLLLTWSRGRLIPLIVLITGAGIWYGSSWTFIHAKMFLSPLIPLLTIAVIFSGLSLLRFFVAEREKRFFQSAFTKYVSKAIVDQMVQSPAKLTMAGEEKEVTVLFTDLRNFTSISEQISPEEVSNLLHEFFTPMTKIITRNYGTLDKFIGDAMMAFWNAPVDVPSHQKLALKSAMEMMAAMEELNVDFSKKFGRKVGFGIGLHFGMVRVGNMGSKDLFDYTVIGDNVNVASRLESMSGYYGVQLVVSEEMAGYCHRDSYGLQELDLIRMKGKAEPCKVFSVYPQTGDELQKELDAYAQALALFRKRNFEHALLLFEQLIKDYGDKKLYDMYCDRCRLFIKTPPSEDWDGAYSYHAEFRHE
ncbi:CHASE2 domain-containing protein [Thermodesulfobacteriota bacterium]